MNLYDLGSVELKKKRFFIEEIAERKKMSKKLNRYITALNYADKT